MNLPTLPLAWIEFDAALGGWSPWTFWVVVVSTVLTLGFTVAVFFGGLADLRFLLRALDEPATDTGETGRPSPPAPEGEAPSHP